MEQLVRSVVAFASDLRHGVRVLARSPFFTVTAVVIFAVGLGANAAIFSLVDTLLLRPLPYPQPDRLELVGRVVHSNGTQGIENLVWSQDGRTWQTLREHARTVDLAPYSGWPTGVNLVADGAATYVKEQRVGAGFFRVLGVAPALGRGFTREEDVPGGAPVVVLSQSLWMGHFGGDPEILGKRVALKGEPYTVIGVMPAGFRSTEEADLWTPLRPSTTGEGGGTNYGIVVRRKPGVSRQQAEAEIAALGARVWEEERSDWPPGMDVRFTLGPLRTGLTSDLRQPLSLLWAAVVLALVVVCANLASLMLARSSGRRRELAARMALGGSRAAIVRTILAEGVLVAVAGTVLGIGLGHLALGALSGLAHQALGFWQPVALDLRVLGATAVIALVACVGFGLWPALSASRIDLREALAQGGSGAASGGATHWPRRLLVVGEVAVGVVLLIFSGLLVRTFVHLRSLDTGVYTAGVVTGTVSLHDARYATRAEIEHLFTESLERIRRWPGIESAAIGLGLPFERPLNLGFRALPAGGEPTEPASVSALYVTPGYFETLGVPLLRGRSVQRSDGPDGALVAVVNSAFVDRYLGGASPLDSRISIAGDERQIVGVVGNVLYDPSGQGGTGPLVQLPAVYVPSSQMADQAFVMIHTWFEPSWVVRSALDPDATVAALRRAVREVAPELPFARFQRLDQVEATALGEQRFLMSLVLVLAGIAAALAALGIYGLIAASVTERTRELGIRLALGATRAQVLRAVVLPGVALTAAGTVLGVAGALAGARLVRSLVVGVSTTDPWSLAAGAATLLVIATLASLLPGLDVLELDPARTLREE